MKSFLKNKTGSALIGLLLAVVIVAALAYGSSFFWKSNNKGSIQNNLDIKEKAETDINKISQTIKKQNDLINNIAEDNDRAEKISNDMVDWQVLERESFTIKYPNGWYYTINYKDAREQGYAAIIGFGPTKAVWEQKSPYNIELIVADSKNEIVLNNYNSYKIISSKDIKPFYYNL
ncbi:MAG: hypothetical protein U9R06_00365, partial [Patescibacteria group bacterium]|nr:hypothetical protein [Patescibacteria group bacterium]